MRSGLRHPEGSGATAEQSLEHPGGECQRPKSGKGLSGSIRRQRVLIIMSIRKSVVTSLGAIADVFNKCGVPTARGGRWRSIASSIGPSSLWTFASFEPMASGWITRLLPFLVGNKRASRRAAIVFISALPGASI
jgi:hypothetical protein